MDKGDENERPKKGGQIKKIDYKYFNAICEGPLKNEGTLEDCLITTPLIWTKGARTNDGWEKKWRRGRATHSVANAGKPSQGQDQLVNLSQSTKGLAPSITNDLILRASNVIPGSTSRRCPAIKTY
ncbi:hypothetical protein KPH14_011780 [Odynerus spinipes]|uniref:Uncharacterized protein n=1 Tax=Odynerus spinipes TaxID=1348599 RepID=A0AAD9RVL6_9HYME|nr:hypothetical protein KPH14_011780 [Odynerus spinipes]